MLLFYCSIVLLFNYSIVLLFYYSFVRLFFCSFAQMFKYSFVQKNYLLQSIIPNVLILTLIRTFLHYLIKKITNLQYDNLKLGILKDPLCPPEADISPKGENLKKADFW